jgi:membrane-bound inhibitor of C-type lysozyme
MKRALILLAAAALLGACQTAAPAQQAGRSFSWVCPDGARFSTSYPNDERAILSLNGHRYTLSSAMSASGARYAGDGYEFWEHQGEARLTDASGGVHESCRAN